MTPEEFRRYGHQAIDWVAEFLAHVERYPVLPPVKPGELTDALPAHGPEKGEPMEAILADFERLDRAGLHAVESSRVSGLFRQFGDARRNSR